MPLTMEIEMPPRLCPIPTFSRSILLPILILCLGLLGLATRATAADNPCSLLTTAEVEAMLGEPLAGPPFRADGIEPSATGGSCRYETASFRAIDVEVEWRDGGQIFGITKMATGLAEGAGLKGVLTLSDGTELHGSWDDAAAFMCCQFNALREDTLVMIDISSSRLTQKDAGALADLAVARLAEPLDVADDAGVAQAHARAKTRPVPASACTLVTRAEAEALIGAPLQDDPAGDENRCSFVWTPAGADYQMQIDLSVTWRGGFGEFRQTVSAIGGGLDMIAAQGLDMTQDSGPVDPAFDDYYKSIIGVIAVRKDVFLSIESGPDSEMAEKFIAVAAAKL
jgi:hypothetical protein